MKKVFFLPFLFIFLLFNQGCKKDAPLPMGVDSRSITNSDYDFTLLSELDKTKVVLSKLIARNLQKPEFADFLFSELVDGNTESVEVFYLLVRDGVVGAQGTFYDYLVSEIQSDQTEGEFQDILDNIPSVLPTLVIDLPNWIAGDFTGMTEGFTIWPCTILGGILPDDGSSVWYGYIEHQTVFKRRLRNESFTTVPIQVKESEEHLLLNLESGILWNETDIRSGILTGEPCPAVLDKINDEISSLNPRTLPDLPNLSLISYRNVVPLAYSACSPYVPPLDPPIGCSGECDRDCVSEVNYIDGLGLFSAAVYDGINNQPAGEETYIFNLRFLTAQMCGDLTASSPCPSNVWSKNIFLSFDDIMDVVALPPGSTPPPNSRLVATTFQNLAVAAGYGGCGGSGPFAFCDLFLVPKVADIRAKYPLIIPYLEQLGTNEWDGDHYGSSILVSASEHDEVTVANDIQITEERAASTKVSLNLVDNKQPDGSFEFSNSVKKSSTVKYTYSAEKDVLLGDMGLAYCNPSFTVDVNSPYTHNTGSLAVYFAYE